MSLLKKLTLGLMAVSTTVTFMACSGNKSNETKINSIDKLKQENKKRENIKEIVEITEKNPEVLNNLSVKQLKVIDNYYDESLEEINKKIAEFKATLKK